MIAFLSTNRAGRPCCCWPDGVMDSFDTVKEAADAVRRANAQVRLIAKRDTQERARISLGALARRLNVGLHILPDFLPAGTDPGRSSAPAVCA